MKTVLVGVNHHLEQFSAVSNGMRVELVHDTENRYSQYAVSVVVDGIGVIGHMTENYVPTGFKHIADEVINSKTFINEVLAENKGFRAEILQKKPNGAVIGIVLDANDSNQQTEEDNMINWTENASEEVITVVGCAHNQTVKNVGDKVHIEVLNYAACPDGHVKGTSAVFNENGETIGVLPQSESKLQVLNENECVYLTNEQFKSKYASDIAQTEGYVIIDISECGRYVKLGTEVQEQVIEETENNKEELYMNKTIEYGINKMGELKTLYDVENIVEDVVKAETVDEVSIEAETVSSIEKQLKALNKEIRALSKKEEAIKAKKEALMAKREELAAINASRITLIENISVSLENLELPVLEAIQAVISSSGVEEDKPSTFEGTIIEKVHEGKEELSHEEWEEYVETYWKRGFDALREAETNINCSDKKAIERYVRKIKRFNKKLNQFKNEGYNKILTLYWVENYMVLKTICEQYNLTATRLTGSCIIQDNDITLFLESN